jgi:hypothetical protein
MRAILLSLTAVLALLCGGCCTLVPPAAKYFQRTAEDPTETLRGFVYAVETKQWDYAYECLCESSRQEIGRWKFEVAIRAGSDPLLHEAALFDIIAQSVPHHSAPRISPERTHAWITVLPDVKGDDGKPIFFKLDLSFRREAGEWRLDFVESSNHLQREMERAGAPAATQ